MPITNTRDVIPFVNGLEETMEKLQKDIGSWLSERQKIAGYGTDIANINFRSTGAFSRAEEALSEIGNATSGVLALKGQRLQKLIEGLKQEVRVIAEEAAANGGGGGAFFDERITKEINNAVASVSALVPEGLKLDARIQEVADLATNGGQLGNKEIVIPVKRAILHLGDDEVTLDADPDIKYLDGEVGITTIDAGTVLTKAGKAAVAQVKAIENGRKAVVTLPDIDLGQYHLFVPAEVAMHAWPREALEAVMGATISRTSGTFRKVAEFEAELAALVETVQSMQGVKWTADVTLMKNRQDIIKESITPKGLQIEAGPDGKVNVSFSYADHENLSHFVLEKMGPDESWVPYDGDQGIVTAE